MSFIEKFIQVVLFFFEPKTIIYMLGSAFWIFLFYPNIWLLIAYGMLAGAGLAHFSENQKK